jgi:hypothetical protein
MTHHNQQHSTWLAAHDAELTTSDLWVHYVSVGGNLTLFELDAYLHGLYPTPVGERNMIAAALNELIDDLPQRPKAEIVVDLDQE